MIVHIIGTGKSLITYTWPAGAEKWSVGSAYAGFLDRIDMYFCMHDKDPKDEIVQAGIPVMTKYTYPLNSVMAEFDSAYLTNSISYMLAYAILEGYKEIHLPGVDVSPYSEYAFERPSIAFWCGIAKARGIKVVWDMIEPHTLYGYTEKAVASFLEILKEHRKQAEYHRSYETDPDKHHQWTGYIAACNMLEREVKS